MSKLIPFSLFVAMVVAIVAACKHDPFIFDNPTYSNTCDPDSVYFQQQILPILVSNCTESGCHNAQDHEEGVILDSYSNLVRTVENGTLNNLQENKMMRSILDNDPEERMPPAPKDPLNQEQIDLLKGWLAQGAPNNGCDENSGGCDPASVTYSQFIKPLNQSRCQGCHSGSNPQGGIKLTTYQEIKTQALNGKYYGSLTKTSGWMPKGGAKLDDCSLQKIQAWISAGAPEN